MDLNVPLPVIGVVHTSYAELEATPIQAGLNRAEPGRSAAVLTGRVSRAHGG